MARRWTKRNPVLVDLIEQLRLHTRTTGASLWRDLADRLERPRSQWAEPNISRLNRHTEENSTVIVPGTLLGSGVIDGPRVVAAVRMSEAARRKIEAAGGKVLSVVDLMSQEPQGKGVMILG